MSDSTMFGASSVLDDDDTSVSDPIDHVQTFTDRIDERSRKRTDTDRIPLESSPSTGWRETAAIMHTTVGHTEWPTPECDRFDAPVRVREEAHVRCEKSSVRTKQRTFRGKP
ncbi:hypothetical protein [Haladaptatus halobius]|uniref:hypothetical protein n=1 Tax=Haladaptatus halobius TaxID=2884875 RepID=UPI001D09C988|nr:hypothetical protein [Haladaptatus halobius]